MGAPRGTLEQRFWRYVEKIPFDTCWHWVGALLVGYGGIRLGRRTLYAHRVSYEIANGPIPAGMNVLHRCDVRDCVNPDHLYVGTQGNNMQDVYDRKRRGNGQAHMWARVSDNDAQVIRSRYAAGGVSQAALSREFGLSRGGVAHIVHGTVRRAAMAV